MSKRYTTPVETAFEVQRQTIKGGHEFVERTLDAQADAMHAATAAFEAGERAADTTVSMARSATHAYLDAVEATVPGSEVAAVRDAADEAFDAAEATGDDLWNSLAASFEDAVEANEELTESQREMLAEAVEATLEAHRAVEEQATRAAGAAADVVEE